MTPKFGYPATAAGIPFTLSTVGICPVEEVHAAASWMVLPSALASCRKSSRPWVHRRKFSLMAMTLTGVTRIRDIGTDQLDRPQKSQSRKAGEQE